VKTTQSSYPVFFQPY